jgi:hypothetical protein
MLYDPKTICNLGLKKIAASPVSSLEPPRTPIEKHCADGYPHWKRTELAKRRWVFATEFVQLTQEGPAITDSAMLYALGGRNLKYKMPSDAIRLIRDARTEWVSRGGYIYSSQPNLIVEVILDKTEDLFSSEFAEVLACRVAKESVEFATQSNTKTGTADALYNNALSEAGKNNAFVIGSEKTNEPDDESDWLNARAGYYG